MIRKLIWILLCIFSLSASLQAQSRGSVTVVANSKIDQIMESYALLMSQNPGIEGYRILIFSDSGNYSKNAALNAKEEFEKRFPDIDAYIFFEEPNYKVRVGNFRSRLEAERCLHKISNIYSNTIIVPDFIEFPKLAIEQDANED